MCLAAEVRGTVEIVMPGASGVRAGSALRRAPSANWIAKTTASIRAAPIHVMSVQPDLCTAYVDGRLGGSWLDTF